MDRLDLLGFDACLMAAYEVQTALAPYADYFVASEELEPGHGWDYAALQLLRDAPATGPAELGEAIADGFLTQAIAQGTDADITLSLTDLSVLPTFQQALTSLVRALNESITDVAPVLARELAQTLAFGRGDSPGTDTNLVDLGDLLRRLGDDVPEAVAVARSGVFEALQNMVVHQVTGSAMSQASGVSIYFPPSADYYLQQYSELAEPARWKTLLDAYFEAGSQIPGPGGGDGTATATIVEGGVIFSAPLPEGMEEVLSEVTLRYGVVEPDGRVLLLGAQPGVTQPALPGDPVMIQGSWDQGAIVLDDGVNTMRVFLAWGYREVALVIDIPLEYRDASGETWFVLLDLVLNPDLSVAQGGYYIEVPGGALAELTPEPGSTLSPLVPVIAPDGTEGLEVQPQSIDATAQINIRLERLPALTPFYGSLEAVDFGGNLRRFTVTGVLP